MKAEELRLGNLVSNMNPRHNDSILIIESIGDNHEVNVFYRKYLLSELEPILLTEEWLLKFGFEKNKEHGYFELDRLIVAFHDGVDSFYLCDIDIFVKIETVHHLQNLYFAIRSKELTLKP
jgi:hypothetical protein